MSTRSFALETSPELHPAEFELIRELAYRHFGLDLNPSKQGLVAARLGKRLRELGLRSYREYYDHILADRGGAAMTGLVDCLTTNHTSFFREARHFDLLSKVIYPELQSRSQIHIWSAACSTGEEPYSIAMTLLEASRGAAATQVRIKATDISTRVLAKARCGCYPTERLSEIPQALRQRYLQQHPATPSSTFHSTVRSMIDFQHLNLIGPLPERYRCSVIFCRNIMIYFDKPTQQRLVQRLTTHLEDGGYLFIGHSESLNAITHGLEYISPATYRKPLPTPVKTARWS